MRTLRPITLIVLAGSLALAFPPARPAPISQAQTELSPGCTALNEPFFDDWAQGLGRRSEDYYAGERITVTAGDSGQPFAGPMWIALEGTQVISGSVPGTLSYVFPANTRVGFYAGIQSGNVPWTITCAWVGLPPAAESAAALPGCDVLLPIPSTSVMGTFLVDVVVDYAPGAVTVPPVVLPQGQTAWVLGVDAAHATYKIAWSCTYLWVPISAMGPTYDALWQGWPLPEIVVE